MAGDDVAIWERFIASKVQNLNSGTQNSSTSQANILGTRSFNLSSGSIALNADADMQGLMCDLTIKPASEILTDKSSRELARRSRYVDFVRLALACCRADPDSRAKKVSLAVKSIEAILTGLVVDKAARNLQSVLLAGLDDISPDLVPLVVDVILAPCLSRSRHWASSPALGRPDSSSPAYDMDEDTAAAFLMALDILPKMLGIVAGVPALAVHAPVPECVRGLSGAQYKDRVVNRLLRARWPSAVSIGICQTLRDLDLEDRQLKMAVSRVLRHLRRHANLDELPPLTYQLLLLADRGCKEAALEGVIRVFDRLDAAAQEAGRGNGPMRGDGRLGAHSTEHLWLVEGTILLHVNFAMKQDHNLAGCLLKGFERRAVAPEIARAFTPFRVALLLSLSRIQRFSQPVLDLVQDVVSGCLAYDHRKESSAWLEGQEEACRSGGGGSGGAIRPAEEEDGGGSDGECSGVGASSARVVERVLLAVVRSSRGWDHLVGSLLKLGLQLLDRGGSVATGLGGPTSAASAAKGLLEKLQTSRSHRASLRAAHLGRVVLMETFKIHEVVRRQVLTSVLEQVTARSQGVMGYVKLLGLLSKTNPQLLLQDAEAVRDVFAYVSVLAPPVAERFLAAVAPLLQLRPRLQDSVVLPLRKALFSREERARLVAVGGLVLLLGTKNRSRISGEGLGATHGGTQLSQTSQTSDVLSAPFPVGGVGAESGCALSLAEGFGLLRRCLTQQLVVRAKLYDGLLASFERGSLEFQLDAISLLMGHLRRFVNRTGGGAVLVLSRCLDSSSGEIVEPLPLLISCLHRMAILGKESLAEHVGIPDDSDRMEYDRALRERAGEAGNTAAEEPLREVIGELEGCLQQLSAASSATTLEEFGLDKVTDFSPSGGPLARENLATAALLCGCYEALMQGALILMGRPAAGATAVASPTRLPAAGSVRVLLKLFDRRQALFDLVRPRLQASAHQRGKKATGRGGGSRGSSSGIDSDPDGSANGGVGATGAGVGQPGFSPGGCFGLTLYPGGMPCLGMAFVEDMLAVLNMEAEDGDEMEGETEPDPVVMEEESGSKDPPSTAVREDLGLQQLVLETCRGHLRQLRTATAAASDGLSLKVGGGASCRGIVSTCVAYGGAFLDGPQDEADAAIAGKAGVKKCIRLAPLLMKEVFRQLTEGNDSKAAKATAAAAAVTTTAAKASNAKGKNAGGDKGKKKTPLESLAELSLSCLEECVCIAAYSSYRARTRASRTARLLEAAYKDLPDSNVAPVDPARGRMGSSALGKYAEALMNTLTNLVVGGQTKEAKTVCRILSHLTLLLSLEPECLEKHGASLKLLCRQQRIQSPVLAKAVVSLYLQAHVSMKSKRTDMCALQDLARQVRACVGRLGDEDDEEEEDEPPALTFEVINNFTIVHISEITVRAVETCVDDVEDAVRLLQKAAVARQARDAAQSPGGVSTFSRGDGGGGDGSSQSSATISEDELSSDEPGNSDRNVDSDCDAAGLRSDGGSGERDPLDRRETLVCDRLQGVMRAMETLVESRLEGRSTEKLVSSASRVFRVITKVLKVRLSLKKSYVGHGLKHVLACKKDFTDALLRLVPHLEDEKGAKVTKNNITRQSRLVPTLIFEMEECDVQLLKLGKICKGSLDLPKWVSKRVDRDFRINRKAIASCQEETRASREKRKRKGKEQTRKGAPSSNKKSASKSEIRGKLSADVRADSSEEQGDEDEEDPEKEQEEEETGGAAEGDSREDDDEE